MVNSFRGFCLIFLISIAISAKSQVLVDTTVQNRNVLLELFTGVRCGYAYQALDTLNQLKAMHGDNFFPVAIHAGNLAAPFPGEVDYRTTYGDSIFNMAFADAIGYPYPLGTINRHIFADNNSLRMARIHFSRYSDSILNSYQAAANIGIGLSLDTANNVLHIQCEVYYTNNTIDSINKLHIVLLQHNVKSLQREYKGVTVEPVEFVQSYMLRQSITGLDGIPIYHTSLAAHKLKVDTVISYTIPTQIDNLPVVTDDLQVIAFITDVNNKEVVNVNGASVSKFASINKYDLDLNVEVFPNPSSDQLTINTYSKKTNLQIINQLGELLYNNTNATESVSINISGFSPGIYFIKVMADENFKTIKFIKE
jgi:hypothetical protein